MDRHHQHRHTHHWGPQLSGWINEFNANSRNWFQMHVMLPSKCLSVCLSACLSIYLGSHFVSFSLFQFDWKSKLNYFSISWIKNHLNTQLKTLAKRFLIINAGERKKTEKYTRYYQKSYISYTVNLHHYLYHLVFEIRNSLAVNRKGGGQPLDTQDTMSVSVNPSTPMPLKSYRLRGYCP